MDPQLDSGHASVTILAVGTQAVLRVQSALVTGEPAPVEGERGVGAGNRPATHWHAKTVSYLMLYCPRMCDADVNLAAYEIHGQS